jgi:hypothetical protein
MKTPVHDPTRRSMLLAGMAFALGGCAGGPSRPSGPASSALRLIGEATLPHKMSFAGTTVGGLSALDFDPSRNCWYALSDDRSALQPARLYTLRIPLAHGSMGKPELLSMTVLRQPDGTPYPSQRAGGEVADPEGLRFHPGTNTLLWTSEGDRRMGLAPFLREISLEGRHLRELELPAMFRPTPTAGPRDNLGFEGLAITPDGTGAWAAMEGPLIQDGPTPGVGRPGGPCRLTSWDVASGKPVRQVAYMPDAIPAAPVPPGSFADNGISEILMIDAHRMLVLERAYMTGVGNSLRLYVIDSRQGSDTLSTPALREGSFTACRKTLVADLSAAGLSRLDNTEGMGWGPMLPGGGRTLVIVSDDNFNPGQITQFAAFEFKDNFS